MRGVLLAILLLAPTVGCVAAGPEKLQHATGAAPTQPEPAAAPGWIDVAHAKIRPGSPIFTPQRVCASNFVFIRPDNTSLFIGTSANCVRELPVGALVTVGDNESLGVLVYSSWQTMQEINETDADARNYNDFAVIRIDDSSRKWAHPSMLHYGGPVGQSDYAGLGPGERIRSYQNVTPPARVALLGADPTNATPEPFAWHEGVITSAAGQWAYLAYTAVPGTPGSLGGGVLDSHGRAVGVMVNVGVAPNPGANGIARLDKVMAYAMEHAKLDMALMTWDLEAGAL